MTLVFQVKGAGTKWLAGRRAGDLLDVLGTLGHGFRMQELGARPIFVGGGHRRAAPAHDHARRPRDGRTASSYPGLPQPASGYFRGCVPHSGRDLCVHR